MTLPPKRPMPGKSFRPRHRASARRRRLREGRGRGGGRKARISWGEGPSAKSLHFTGKGNGGCARGELERRPGGRPCTATLTKIMARDSGRGIGPASPRSPAADVLDLHPQLMFMKRLFACLFSVPPLSALAMLACLNARAHAAQCGSGAGGFEAWKQRVRRRSPCKRHRRLGDLGADGDELRQRDHQRRPRPAQF